MRSRTRLIPESELGTCVLETSWYIMVAEGTMASGQIQYFTDNVMFDAEFSLQATIEVLAADAETVELVCDESLRGAIEESLTLRSFRISGASRPSVVTGWFEVVDPPMDFAFDVFVSVGEREWLVGQVDSEVDGQTGLGRMFSRWVTDLDRDRVDLILRPSRSAARRTLGITRIWDGEIIIEDVALTPRR